MDITEEKHGEEIISNNKISNMDKTPALLKNIENFSTLIKEKDENSYIQKIQELKIEVILQEINNDTQIEEDKILTCNIHLNLLERFLTKIRVVGNQ